MSLLKKQIKTLIATMSKVKEVESFDMRRWHYYDDTVECGFAACICGFQAVARKSKFFCANNVNDFDDQALCIAENLDSSCDDLMGDGSLVRSIYNGDCGDRYYNACISHEFTEEDLKHPHLNKNKPTPADAISFMELVLTKLDDIK